LDIQVPNGIWPDGAAQVVATVVVADGLVTICRSDPAADVRVNGVSLGAEPSPLLHGDRIEVDGHDLFFGEDTRLGQTLLVRLPPELAASSANGRGAAPANGATTDGRTAHGGRLVSLVDGREYSVGSRGLVIGRDVGCDVVVATAEVSRRHAEIVQGPDGYMVRDASTNGVWVNEERVAGSRALVRGDVVRVGGEEFRFHAERAKVGETSGTISAPAESQSRAVLATLEIVNEGVLKGRCFDVIRPLTHLGRGEHNDIVIADESVSDSHANIQRRETGWYVVDVGSKNGTYVAGQRIVNEHPISGSVALRFGGVKMMFRPESVIVAESGTGTRAIAAVQSPVVRRSEPAPRSARPSLEQPHEENTQSGESFRTLLIAVVAMVVVSLYLVLLGR
jgi:pSer/pThr/pTyr-binding forkhead associated (FHA) protein